LKEIALNLAISDLLTIINYCHSINQNQLLFDNNLLVSSGCISLTSWLIKIESSRISVGLVERQLCWMQNRCGRGGAEYGSDDHRLQHTRLRGREREREIGEDPKRERRMMRKRETGRSATNGGREKRERSATNGGREKREREIRRGWDFDEKHGGSLGTEEVAAWQLGRRRVRRRAQARGRRRRRSTALGDGGAVMLVALNVSGIA
jgi:hypothetical protein